MRIANTSPVAREMPQVDDCVEAVVDGRRLHRRVVAVFTLARYVVYVEREASGREQMAPVMSLEQWWAWCERTGAHRLTAHAHGGEYDGD